MREVNDVYHGGDTERLLVLSREFGIEIGELRASRGLERRVSMITALLRLTLTMPRVLGSHVDAKRISSAAHRQSLLSALEHARRVMPVSAALRVLCISAALP